MREISEGAEYLLLQYAYAAAQWCDDNCRRAQSSRVLDHGDTRSHGGMCISGTIVINWCEAAFSSPSTMTAPSSQLSKTLRRMLVRTQALVEAGVIEQPKWLDAVTR